jgi:hypothetical protein
MTPSFSRALVAALGLAVLVPAPARKRRHSTRTRPRARGPGGRPPAPPDLGGEAALLGGDREFYIRPIERLGLPEVRLADGPLGVRNWGLSPSYPSTAGLAASWDTNAAQRFGSSMASDARARGVSVMLGPAVNMMRVPVNGRNFEYMSEDPYLAGVIATKVVRACRRAAWSRP